MHVQYDKDLLIAGVAIVPWNRIGPEQWFKNYRVASLYDWGILSGSKLPELILPKKADSIHLQSLNTQNLICNSDFQDALRARLPGYKLLTYKPVKVPAKLADFDFLSVDESFAARYENKAEFRQKFEGKLKFPKFKVFTRADLPKDQTGFKALQAGREIFVLQDEQLSGGKGTFLIKDYFKYQHALESLSERSRHTRVVVSDVVEGARERSIQAVVTAHGVFSGPLQRQIIRNPALANLQVDGDNYCGAVICKEDQLGDAHKQAQKIAQIVGQDLLSAGFKGIFGIDFLLDYDENLFVLEVNPRITGVTPLLTSLYHLGDIPFYLLHILELGGFEYGLDQQLVPFSAEGTMMLLHSLSEHTTIVDRVPLSGTYSVNHLGLIKVSDNVRVRALEEGQFVIQNFLSPGQICLPGRRLLSVQTKAVFIDIDNDKLYNSTLYVINSIYESIKLKKI